MGVHRRSHTIVNACLAISLSVNIARPQSGELAAASQRMQSGDYAGARTLLEELIRQTPQLPEAHNLLGVCLRELQDTAASVAQFRMAIKLAPGYENASLNLGSTLFSLHDEAGALAVLNELIRIHPNSVEGHLALAKVELARGDESAAVQQLEKVIQLDPHNAFALANAGLIESRRGNLTKASGYMARALAADPRSRPLRLALIELDLKQRRTTEAGTLSGEIAHDASLTPTERQTLAMLLLNGGLTDKGLVLVDGDRELGERFCDAAMARAKQKFQAGKFQDTVAILGAIRSLRAQDAELHRLLGLAWFEIGETKKASDELQEAIKLEPRNPDRYIQLGFVYLKHRTPDLAQIVFEHGLAEAPNSAQLWLWFGLSQHLADDSIHAQQSVEKALAIDPGLVEGYVVLGDILESDGRLAEASDVFRQAIEKRPKLAIGYYYCGKVALEGGGNEAEQALAFLTESIALNPDFAEAHYERGRALEQLGRFQQAAAEYRTSLAKNHNLPQAHYRLALLSRKLGETRAAEMEMALFQKTKLQEKDTVLEHLEYRIGQP